MHLGEVMTNRFIALTWVGLHMIAIEMDYMVQSLRKYLQTIIIVLQQISIYICVIHLSMDKLRGQQDIKIWTSSSGFRDPSKPHLNKAQWNPTS